MKNDNFSPTLKSNWPLRLEHQSYIDMTYKNNINKNFSLL